MRGRQALTREFNDVMASGEIPTSWQKHRMLLHYKGPSAHPGVCGGARINPRIAFGLNVHGRCPKNKMAILKNESFK